MVCVQLPEGSFLTGKWSNNNKKDLAIALIAMQSLNNNLKISDIKCVSNIGHFQVRTI